MSSSDGQFYVERLAGHETLKKTNFCVSEEKLQYLIEEFKVEWDFFSTTPPDDVSKLVCQTRFTFLKVGIQLQLELEIWKKDEPKKVDKVVFVKIHWIFGVLKLRVLILQGVKTGPKNSFWNTDRKCGAFTMKY